MEDNATNRERALEEATRLATRRLAHADLSVRCALLGLAPPGKDGAITMPLFGKPVLVSPVDFTVREEERGTPVRPADRVLALRTVAPLVRAIGSDLTALRARLDRFSWSEIPMGDLGARIHAVGALHVTLSYRAGDDEFPPSADLLFDAAVKRALSTEDAAAMATRVCLGLL